jgi:hypothetical protein
MRQQFIRYTYGSFQQESTQQETATRLHASFGNVGGCGEEIGIIFAFFLAF